MCWMHSTELRNGGRSAATVDMCADAGRRSTLGRTVVKNAPLDAADLGAGGLALARCCSCSRVLTTQIGFVAEPVAMPAVAADIR